jgi:hypothetical protein
VILSGLLWDGVGGLRAIKAAGGTCLVRRPSDSTFDSLPLHALETVQCDLVGTPFEIARLVEFAAGRRCASALRTPFPSLISGIRSSVARAGALVYRSLGIKS